VVNLAVEWGRRRYRTLVGDLDTQAHARIGVGCGTCDRSAPACHGVFRDPGFRLAEALEAGRPVCGFALRSGGALGYRIFAEGIEALWT